MSSKERFVIGSMSALALLASSSVYAACSTASATAGAVDAGLTTTADGQFNIFYMLNSSGNFGRRFGNAATPPSSMVFENLGGVLTSEPSAVSWGAGHVAVFARGSDRALWYRQWDNGSATAWTSLGGVVTWNPSVVSQAPGHLIAFARGSVATEGVWYREYSAGTWGPWLQLGGHITSSPSAIVTAPNRVAVVVRGSDGNLWTNQRTDQAWSGFQSLGGPISGDQSVVTRGSGMLDVFVRWTNNTIAYISYNGSSWGPWQTLGAPASVFNGISEPGAVATASGHLAVYARGMVLQGHNGNPDVVSAFKRTSSDGGVTWSAWQGVDNQVGLNLGAVPTNPEVATTSFSTWAVAPHGNIPLMLCTESP